MSLAENRKANFDYEVLEKLEAGLVLSGPEVKAIKAGHASLKGAFVTFHGGNAYLTNAHISKYEPAGPQPNYDPTRSRRLLLHKKDLKDLQAKALEQGLTIVPLSVYTKDRLVKVEVAVAKGKHKYDKRETLKKRDIERDIKRAL